MSRGDEWADRGVGRARSQRMLVRILLALRREAHPRRDAMRDAARAELLADRIMRELPRSVLPVGFAALLALTAYCALPFLHDFLRATGAVESPPPMTRVVESGLRERGAALGDGIEVLGSIVAPLISDAPRESEDRGAREAGRPSDARAPIEDS
ncbi:MAG: hypothetical protein RI967_1329 [Planctomycetota bacterium]|jgi:hypothetical protein